MAGDRFQELPVPIPLVSPLSIIIFPWKVGYGRHGRWQRKRAKVKTLTDGRDQTKQGKITSKSIKGLGKQKTAVAERDW